MEKLKWIADRWVSVNGESRTYEEWTVVNENLFEGYSKTIKNGEIIFYEKLKIKNTPEGIFYVADVSHNPSPVSFKLTESESNKAVFENPEHDFPTKITYLFENGTLHAFIEGPGENGVIKKIDFYMDKMR